MTKIHVVLIVLIAITARTHAEVLIAPTLATKLTATNSVVYCPTLLIAWDGLKRIVGGPVEMENEDVLAGQLNDAISPIGDVSDEAHVSMAGFTGQGIVPQIKTALREKFGNDAPELPAIFTDQRTVLVTYSYLSRSLPFPEPFERSATTPLMFHSGRDTHPVHFFGASQIAAWLFAVPPMEHLLADHRNRGGFFSTSPSCSLSGRITQSYPTWQRGLHRRTRLLHSGEMNRRHTQLRPAVAVHHAADVLPDPWWRDSQRDRSGRGSVEIDLKLTSQLSGTYTP